VSRARLNRRNLRRAATLFAKIVWRIGIRSDYRRIFWGFARTALGASRFDELLAVALVAHHMITFARECGEGRQRASFYADGPQPSGAENPVAA